MYLCKFGAEKTTGSEDRAQKRRNLQFLMMMFSVKYRTQAIAETCFNLKKKLFG